jgi:hypothetical protein
MKTVLDGDVEFTQLYNVDYLIDILPHSAFMVLILDSMLRIVDGLI